MVVFSRLAGPLRSLVNSQAKTTASAVSRRWMSGGANKLQILPSNLEYTVWKDEIHYFVMMGFVPLGILLAYCNLFVGQAVLSETPEDYYPKSHEYHKHPISRFIAKYMVTSYEREYEKHLHLLDEEHKAVKVRRLERRVHEVMMLRQDFKGWYFIPVNERRIQKAHEFEERDSHA